jgi:hypothetical protein
MVYVKDLNPSDGSWKLCNSSSNPCEILREIERNLTVLVQVWLQQKENYRAQPRVALDQWAQVVKQIKS